MSGGLKGGCWDLERSRREIPQGRVSIGAWEEGEPWGGLSAARILAKRGGQMPVSPGM